MSAIHRRDFLLGTASTLSLAAALGPVDARQFSISGLDPKLWRGEINMDQFNALLFHCINFLESATSSNPAGYPIETDAFGYANTLGSKTNKLSCYVNYPNYGNFAGPYVIAGQGDGSVSAFGHAEFGGASMLGSPVIGTIAPNSGYSNATYTNVAMSTVSGSGAGMKATVQVGTTFTATGSGTTLTVATGVNGSIQAGDTITGTGIPGGTTIVGQILVNSGQVPGAAGTYQTSQATTASGSACTCASGQVRAVIPTSWPALGQSGNGGYAAGDILSASGIGAGSGFQLTLTSYGYIEDTTQGSLTNGWFKVAHQNTNTTTSSNPPWYIVFNRTDNEYNAAFDIATEFAVYNSDYNGTGSYITNCAYYRQSDETDFRAGLHYRQSWKEMIVNLNPSAIRFMGQALTGEAAYISTNYRYSCAQNPLFFNKNIGGGNYNGLLKYGAAYNPVDGVHYAVDAVTGTPASMTHGEIVQCLFPKSPITPQGTQAPGGPIEWISNDTNAVVSIFTSNNPNNGNPAVPVPNTYNVGDVIQFSWMTGMPFLNKQLATITSIISPYVFAVNIDTTNTATYPAWSSGTASASVVGGISDGGGINPGTVLTVASVVSGSLAVGARVTGVGIAEGTVVLEILTGSGGVGTYTVGISQLVATGTAISGYANNHAGFFGLYVTLNVGGRGDFPICDVDGTNGLAVGFSYSNGFLGILGGYTISAAASWAVGASTITMSEPNPYTVVPSANPPAGVRAAVTIYNNTTGEVVGTVGSYTSGSSTLTLATGAPFTGALSASSGSSDVLSFGYTRSYAFDKNFPSYVESNGTQVLGAWVCSGTIIGFASPGLWNINATQPSYTPYEMQAQAIWEIEQYIIENGLQSTKGPINLWTNIPHTGLLSIDPDYDQADHWAINALKVILNGNAGFQAIPSRCVCVVELSNETFNTGTSMQQYMTAYSAWRWFNGTQYQNNPLAACWATCFRSAVMIKDLQNYFGSGVVGQNGSRVRPTITDFPFGLGYEEGSGIGQNGFARCFAMTIQGTPSPWSSVTTYSKGQQVSSSGVNYQSLVNGNLNQTPSPTASPPVYWMPLLTESQCPYVYDADYPFNPNDFPIKNYWAYSDGCYLDAAGSWLSANLSTNLTAWLAAGNNTAISSLVGSSDGNSIVVTISSAAAANYYNGGLVVLSNMNPTGLSGIPARVSNLNVSAGTMNLNLCPKGGALGGSFVSGNLLQMDNPNQVQYVQAYGQYLSTPGAEKNFGSGSSSAIAALVALAENNISWLTLAGAAYAKYEGGDESITGGSYSGGSDQEFWFLCAVRRDGIGPQYATLFADFKATGAACFSLLNALGVGPDPRFSSFVPCAQPSSYSYGTSSTAEWTGMGQTFDAVQAFNDG